MQPADIRPAIEEFQAFEERLWRILRSAQLGSHSFIEDAVAVAEYLVGLVLAEPSIQVVAWFHVDDGLVEAVVIRGT
jgi:hypothetical protein